MKASSFIPGFANPSILKKLFGGNSPAEAARPNIEKIPGATRPYYDPYINRGNEANQVAGSQYNRMTQDPTAFRNEMLSGYRESPATQRRLDETLRRQANTANAGGYRGGPADQARVMDLTNALLSEGEGDYFDQIMRVLGGGLQGQESALGRGFNAASSQADVEGGTLANLGQLDYKQQEEKNMQKQEMMKFISQLLGGGLFQGGMAGSQGQPSSSFGGGSPAGWGPNFSKQYGRGY